MASYFESLLANNDPSELDPKKKPGFLDYVTDIPAGATRGVSTAVQELVKLGFLPIDYIADTNIRSAIDKIFENIKPEVDTPVGEFANILGQYGAPFTLINKLATGIKLLAGASKITKLSSLPTIGLKAKELTKRAGYYGAIGGVTDFVVSDPEENRTLFQTLGYEEDYRGGQLKGSLKAAEDFKQKIKFGAEGILIGGGVTAALPVAGTLGFKYGIKPAGKAVGFVGDQTLRALDYTVANPFRKVLGTEVVQKGVTKTGEKFDEVVDKTMQKLNIPKRDSWKFLSKSPNAPFKERLLKGFDNVSNIFKSPGPLNVESKRILETKAGLLNKTEKNLIKLMNSIDTSFKDIASGYAIRFKEGFKSVPIAKAENDLINDYLRAGGKEAADLFERIKQIDVTGKTNIARNARRLKATMKQLGNQYGKLLADSDDEAMAAIGNEIIKNRGAYMRQVFSAFKNKDYKFDPKKIAGAQSFFKNLIYNPKTKKIVNRDLAEDVNTLAKTTDITSPQWLKALDEYSTNRMEYLKRQIIESNRSPDTIFNAVAQTFKIPTKELRKPFLEPKGLRLFKAGEKKFKQVGEELTSIQAEMLRKGATIQDVIDIRKYKPVTDAFLETSTDYRAAVTDTFMQFGKQIYAKKTFDRLAETGLESGLFFRSFGDAVAKNVNPNNLVRVVPKINYGEEFSSKMFTSGSDGRGLLTTPEISNAIRGVDESFASLYDIPLYKALMSVKATGQIGKTVFSPMTQIRNVSTAGFFALANGLIGGRVSLGDSFKLLADDIFPGKNVDIVKLNRILGDKVARGVQDSNIEVNEIKTILQQSKDGKFSLTRLMTNPTVKRAFDLYQGGDNVWKFYSDEFYQDLLGTAFRHNSKGIAGDAAFRENIIDWYKTVGREARKSDELLRINQKILNTTDLSVKRSLARQFDEIGNVKDISAYLVTNTIPTYSKVPEVIRAIRKLPFGNFIAFPAEILRTSAHIINIGARELTSSNPYIRQMGARRLLGASTVFGGIGSAIAYTAEQITGVTEDKMKAFQRSAAPIYQKNATLIPLTAPDFKGEFDYFNFSYSNPYDSLIRPVNAVLNAYANGTLSGREDEIVFNALFGDRLTNTPGAIAEFLDPFVSESIGAEAVFDIVFRGGKTRDGRQIYFPDQDSALEKIDKSLAHLFTQLEPGANRSVRRVYKGITGTFTQYGSQLDAKTEIGALLAGIRVEKAKPLNSMPFIITAFNKDKQNIRSNFGRSVLRADANAEERLAGFKEYILDSFDSQKTFRQVLNDFETLNIDDSEIRKILEDRIRNKSEVDKLVNGEFKVPSFSEKTFREQLRRLEIEDPIQAAKVELEIDQALESMREVTSDLRGTSLEDTRESVDRAINLTLFPTLTILRGVEDAADQSIGIETIQPKAELPVDQRAAIQPSGNVIAQTIKQPTLTELARADTLGNRFNLLRRA